MARLHANAVRLHTEMLNDRRRTQRYIDAISETVRPGDVVVDLGTGTGILAMAAARAGARRVYAIESGEVGGIAKQLFRANGLADRIQLVAGHSMDIELPERADVLVTETFGHGPLAEGAAEAVVDARRRLLKRGARTVPAALRVFGQPLAVPPAARDEVLFTRANLDRWHAWYGVDFGPLAAVNGRALLTHLLRPDRLRGWRPLAPAVPLAEMELATLRTPRVGGTGEVTARRGGLLGALAVHFELQLSPSVVHATDPRQEQPENHWLNPTYFVVEPLEVQRGHTIRVSYRYTPSGQDEHIDIRVRP